MKINTPLNDRIIFYISFIRFYISEAPSCCLDHMQIKIGNNLTFTNLKQASVEFGQS